MMMMKKASQEFAGAVTTVFWNIDTCPVPLGFDPRRVFPCMKRYLEKLGYTGPLTMKAFGTLTNVSSEDLEAVSSTGVVVCIDPYGSNSIGGYMSMWCADTKKNPSPANLMVITHSTDMMTAVQLSMEKRMGYNIIMPPYPFDPASSPTNAWKSFLFAESRALGKDYPFVTVESSWVCEICWDPTCRGLTGRGFDNFTTHISSQEHADQKLEWINPSSPEDEEYEDEEASVEPPCESIPYVCSRCATTTFLPKPCESISHLCFRCATTTFLPKSCESISHLCSRFATTTFLPKPWERGRHSSHVCLTK